MLERLPDFYSSSLLIDVFIGGMVLIFQVFLLMVRSDVFVSSGVVNLLSRAGVRNAMAD